MLYVLSKCWLLSLYLVHTKYILTKFGWTKYGTDQIWLDQIWHRPNLVGPKMAPTKYGFGPNMGWTKYGPDQICWTKFGPTKNGRPKVSRPNLAWHLFWGWSSASIIKKRFIIMNFFWKRFEINPRPKSFANCNQQCKYRLETFFNDVHRREQMTRSLPLGMLCPLEKCKKIVISYHLTF